MRCCATGVRIIDAFADDNEDHYLPISGIVKKAGTGSRHDGVPMATIHGSGAIHLILAPQMHIQLQ
jgi:hypothetical protein